MANMEKTNAQFEQALAECRALFEKKLHDYKASWRILRPTALTDQLFIKAYPFAGNQAGVAGGRRHQA